MVGVDMKKETEGGIRPKPTLYPGPFSDFLNLESKLTETNPPLPASSKKKDLPLRWATKPDVIPNKKIEKIILTILRSKIPIMCIQVNFPGKFSQVNQKY